MLAKYRFNVRDFTKRAYKAYFGIKLGDQDKSWALHMVCKQCTETLRRWTQGRRVASGGAGGAMPLQFSFLPPPPIYFLPPHGIFLGRSCFFWPEKTLKFVTSVRKSLRISAKTFFFSEITCFWPEENVKISARKSLRKSAKIFVSPILILPPDLAKLVTPLTQGKATSMRFGVSMVWREPKNHHEDCYFCMVDMTRWNQRKKKNRY